LHPKLQKNIYDLSHSRYLEKSHTIANLGFTFWLAFLAGVATYIIEGGHKLNTNLVFIILLGTSVISAFFYSLYRSSKRKRYEIVDKMKELNPQAERL